MSILLSITENDSDVVDTYLVVLENNHEYFN